MAQITLQLTLVTRPVCPLRAGFLLRPPPMEENYDDEASEIEDAQHAALPSAPLAVGVNPIADPDDAIHPGTLLAPPAPGAAATPDSASAPGGLPLNLPQLAPGVFKHSSVSAASFSHSLPSVASFRVPPAHGWTQRLTSHPVGSVKIAVQLASAVHLSRS